MSAVLESPEAILDDIEAANAARSSSKRRHRTGSGAQLSADHIVLYRAVVAATIVTALAAFAMSWNGLVQVAGAAGLPEAFSWLLPVVIDVPIAGMTFVTLIRRSKGQSVLLPATVAYGLTAVSAYANWLHVADGNPLDTQLRVFGAVLAALAPVLVYLSTEVLGLIVTKEPRAEKESARQRIKDLEREVRSLKRGARKEAAS